MRAEDVGRGTFEVSSEHLGRAQHLKISGELDMTTAPILDGWLTRATSNGNAEVILDLEEVSFMDASGLRALMRAADHARRNGQRFAIVKAPAAVRRVVQLTNTTHLLHPGRPTVSGGPVNGSGGKRSRPVTGSLVHPSVR